MNNLVTQLTHLTELGSYNRDPVLSINIKLQDDSSADNIVVTSHVGDDEFVTLSRVYGETADTIVQDQLDYHHRVTGEAPVEVEMNSPLTLPLDGVAVVEVRM